jgi:tetratricopeptide (TPR) repeat protein
MSKITDFLIESDQCRGAGNIAQAMTFAERAVAEIDNTIPPRLSAIAFTKLSQLKQDRGKLSEAESLSRHALKLLDSSARDQSTDYAIACGNLADVLTEEGHYIEAAPLLDEALQIYQLKGQTRTKQYADLLAVKGELLFEQDRVREAIRALTEELQIRQHTNAGPDQLGRLYQNFAVVFEKAGKLSKALEFLRKDQRIWSDALPDDHPDRVSCTAILLVLFTKSRHYAQANSLVPFLLAHGERAFGSDNPTFAVILSNVGMLYERQKQHQQAAVFLRRAFQIDQGALGPFHPTTAYVLKWYGITLTRLGRTEEGRALESQAKAALSLVH